MSLGGTEEVERSARARFRDALRPGVLGSMLVHAAVLGFLLYRVGAPPDLVPFIPVDVVQLAEETTSVTPQPNVIAPRPGAAPSPQVASVAPPRRAPPVPRAVPAPVPPPAPPSAEQPAPDEAPPAPPDPLQSQLDALSKLRTQSSPGAAARLSGGNGPPGSGGYRVEDLVRAQVQRRWSLRLDEIGEREFTVAIHVVLEPDGTVTKAEIVDTARGRIDEVFRSIALSARNAVLLSSPLTLPAGMTAEMRDMTLTFNPRDVLR